MKVKYLLRFAYQIHSHCICANLAYTLCISRILILPIGNIISLAIFYINCRTALHISWSHWFSSVRHIFELDISDFYSVFLYFAGIIVQVIEQVSALITSIYMKGTFTTNLYQLVLSDVYTPVALLQYVTLFYSWVESFSFKRYTTQA